jgi:ketosteroid isomerase-like protein
VNRDVCDISPELLLCFDVCYLGQKQSEKGGRAVIDEVLGIEDSAMEEWRKDNPMRWLEISADDVIYIDPGLTSPIVGKKTYIQYLEPLRGKIFYDASEYVKPHVSVHGDSAVLTYNYHSLSKDPNGTLQRSSFWNTTEVYRLVAGEWKIIHTHWSYIQHHLPESLEMKIPILENKAEPLAGAAAEIMKLETRALERWRKGDPSGGLEIAAPEVTYFDPDTPARLNGFGDLKQLYEALVGQIHHVMEFVNPRFRVFEDSAVLFYQFFSTTLNPDGTIASRTPWNCSEVYAKTSPDGGSSIPIGPISTASGRAEGSERRLRTSVTRHDANLPFDRGAAGSPGGVA